MRSRALSDHARGRRWRWFGWLAIGGLAARHSSSARAQCPSEGYFIALGAAASIIPSETGLLVTADGPRFVLGWSLGVPVADKHHLIPWHGIDDADNAGVHLLVRAAVAPELNQIRGATVLIGWTIL